MVLNAGVGKLVYPRGQFLQDKTVDLVYYFTLLQDITPILGFYEYLTQTLICLKINLKVTYLLDSSKSNELEFISYTDDFLS